MTLKTAGAERGMGSPRYRSWKCPPSVELLTDRDPRGPGTPGATQRPAEPAEIRRGVRMTERESVVKPAPFRRQVRICGDPRGGHIRLEVRNGAEL